MTTKNGFRALITRSKLGAAGLALGGMIVGALVGIAVQVGVESTGILGPGVETLISEQDKNFEALHSRLDNLQTTTSDPELARELAEIAALLERQDELRRTANREIETLVGEVDSLRQQNLVEQDLAGGADVWLAEGEGVSVGDKSNVIGVLRILPTAADVVLNGNQTRLNVGGYVSTEDCLVFLKQATRPLDDRAGFDVTCGEGDPG